MSVVSSIRWIGVLAATGLFVGLAALDVVRAVDRPEPISPVLLAVELAAVALWGGLAVILLARRGASDPHARVFATLAVLVSASIVLAPYGDWSMEGYLGLVLTLVIFTVFFVNPAAVVHMAGVIPRLHPVLARFRWLVPAHYVVGAALATAATWGVWHAASETQAVSAPALRWIQSATLWTYVYGGLAALLLLSSAARRSPSLRGRRQALIVFATVLPWVMVQLARAFLPHEPRYSAVMVLAEAVVIFLVPVGMFVAIFGLRLFEIGLLARRGLIYGITVGTPVVAIVAAWLAGGAVASRTLGLQPTAFNIGLVLLALGTVLRPLARRVTQAVDRAFFPEKRALRRLPRALLPEMARIEGLDDAATRLTSRVREDLGVRSAALLVGDENRDVFRVRAVAGRWSADESVEGTVIHGEDLESGLATFSRRKVSRPELRNALDVLQATTIVPIGLEERPIALLALGPPLAGSGFDREDLRQLERLARQVAAVLEHARVRELARVDALTGLARRRVFDEVADGELERYRRSGRVFSLALFDIDDFKKVNDTHGHPVGDRVLREVARVLAGSRRTTDLAARWGGEEFALVLPDTDLTNAVTVCDAVRSTVESLATPVEARTSIRVTVSAGVAIARSGDTLEALVTRADEALYRAKSRGKNRVEPAPAPDC